MNAVASHFNTDKLLKTGVASKHIRLAVVIFWPPSCQLAEQPMHHAVFKFVGCKLNRGRITFSQSINRGSGRDGARRAQFDYSFL